MNDVTKGVLGSLIAAALIAAGGWLSAVMVKDEVALFFHVNQIKLRSLVVWDMSLSNYNKNALDEVSVKIPSQSIASIEVSENKNLLKDEKQNVYFWEGELKKGESIKLLAVFESTNMAFSDERMKDVAHAKYRIRDEASGTLVWKEVPILKGSEPTTKRALLKVFWFLLPFALAAILSFGLLAVSRLLKNYKTSSVSEVADEQLDSVKHLDLESSDKNETEIN